MYSLGKPQVMVDIPTHTMAVVLDTILPLHILEVCQVEEPQMYELEVQHYPIVKSLLVAVAVLVRIITVIVTPIMVELVVTQRVEMDFVVVGILVLIVVLEELKQRVVLEHQVIRREPWVTAVETAFEAAAVVAVITVVVQGITAAVAAVDPIMQSHKRRT
jgi:hypothetical protein